jgi:2-C-methyl-D-erythritol 4-phosphate cytidylyltransferase
VVLAGGSGSRVGSALNKVYLPLAGRRVLSWSLTWARQVPDFGTFVVVIRPEDAELARQTVSREAHDLPVEFVIGGASRHESEQAALDHLAARIEAGAVDLVAIHDGARPLAGPALWREVLGVARTFGGAVPALPAGGVLPVGSDGHPVPVAAGEGAESFELARVQTPQAFEAQGLHEAYRRAGDAAFQGTDTCATAETHSALQIRTVPGTRTNLKITYPHDLFLAERLLAVHRYQLP